MADSTNRTLSKHIRVLPEQWERVERASQSTALTANQLVIELAIEALARGLIADGHDQEVQEIRAFISIIVPDPDIDRPTADRIQANERVLDDEDHHE